MSNYQMGRFILPKKNEPSNDLQQTGNSMSTNALSIHQLKAKREKLENVSYLQSNPDHSSVIIGVEIIDDSDLETDNDNKLQLYSDVEAAPDSDFILPDNSEQKPARVSKSKKGKGKSYREPSRLSLEDRIKCIRMCCRYESFADVQKAWKQKYNTEPPCRKTLSTLNKKFLKTGSVADLSRTGRPKSTRTEEVIARVEDAVAKDPRKSIRTLAKELGVHQASVHRIRKDFEDKRSTLKMENKKLKDSLNDALKRITLLERRLARSLGEEKPDIGVETLLIADSSEQTVLPTQLELPSSSNPPTIIALNSSNGQMSIPSVLRLQQGGHETIHIITIPQGSSHQLLSLEDSPLMQLSIANDPDNNIQGQTTSANILPISTTSSHENITL